MIILPAIDLKDGKVVRLYQGNFDTVHQVAEDPIQTAQAFYQAGARQIHMVDLDGARDGRRKNSHIIQQVIQHCGLSVELGGGIRTMKDLEEIFALGVARAVIGSAAVTDPAFVRKAVERYGERIAVGIDTKDGMVKTAGWLSDSGLNYLDFAKSMEALGVKLLIFTDIDTDGTLSGPPYDKLEKLQQAVSCRVIASGGVSCNEDIRQLSRRKLYGAIVGKAYYAGTIDLTQAVADGGDQEQ